VVCRSHVFSVVDAFLLCYFMCVILLFMCCINYVNLLRVFCCIILNYVNGLCRVNLMYACIMYVCMYITDRKSEDAVHKVMKRDKQQMILVQNVYCVWILFSFVLL